MDWARQITLKTPAEIAIMREAGRINALVLATVREMLQPGVSTADLDAAAEDVLKKHGAVSPFKGYGYPPFPNSITVSINEELVHGIPSASRKLKEGDIVSADCGTLFDGLCGRSAFTAGVGRFPPKRAKLLEVTEQALYGGIARMSARQPHWRCLGGDTAVCGEPWLSRDARVYRSWRWASDARSRPQVPNYGKPRHRRAAAFWNGHRAGTDGTGGTPKTKVAKDKWTVVSADGSLTAHFEHSVAVTEGDPHPDCPVRRLRKLDWKERAGLAPAPPSKRPDSRRKAKKQSIIVTSAAHFMAACLL